MPHEDQVKQDKNKLRENSPSGTLMMLATHIGRPEDMPRRALAALQSADLLIFEEDRPARSALKSAQVQREYLKFSEHQQKETLSQLRQCLLAGKTATYMSDQGCPTLSDPGGPLLQVAYELKAQIQVVPGPSSLTAAMMACPFALTQFYFAGFLPRDPGQRLEELKALAQRREALIFMDTPYRLGALLSACQQSMEKRRGFLAVDITGEAESYLLGSFSQLQKKVATLGKKNFVLIIEAR